ncbi:MAG: ATP12 family protein [Caulobacterales bacterium]
MTELTKRFYKQVAVAERDGGYAVTLDGRPLRTPGRALFIAPTRALAEACAAEWEAQQELVDPSAMPLTRLANVALDRTPAVRAELAEKIASYCGTDVISHRADGPPALMARQDDAWGPLVVWAREALELKVPVFFGFAHPTGETREEDRLRSLAARLDDFRLTGLAHGAGLAGSAVIAFALLYGRLEAQGAFAASTLEEQYSLDAWGDDALARERLDHIQLEFIALERFFKTLS